MNQNDQAQDTLETEKPAIPATSAKDQPAKKNDTGAEQRPEGQPRAEIDEGPAQPMAHPPEDTFVAAEMNPKPRKSGH